MKNIIYIIYLLVNVLQGSLWATYQYPIFPAVVVWIIVVLAYIAIQISLEEKKN